MSARRRAPLPYQARASRDGELIAETGAAVRVDVPGGAPLLWFPRADVAPRRARRARPRPLAARRATTSPTTSPSTTSGSTSSSSTRRDGDDERDVTIKRFPTWGDADRPDRRARRPARR